MITKLIAGLMVRQILLDAASDETEDTITLVKKPGKKKSKELMVNISFHCKEDRLVVYCEKLIKAAADATNISFEEMVKHIGTCHELIDDVSEEFREDKHED